jgi:arsenate reductase
MKLGFICTGNSARSQMAEAYAKYFAKLYGKQVEIYSAGSQPAERVNPYAIRVMEEEGIDMSAHYPKSIEDIPYQGLDLVITLCGDAKETCPVVLWMQGWNTGGYQTLPSMRALRKRSWNFLER